MFNKKNSEKDMPGCEIESDPNMPNLLTGKAIPIGRNIVYRMDIERLLELPVTQITFRGVSVYIDRHAANELIKIWKAIGFASYESSLFDPK